MAEQETIHSKTVSRDFFPFFKVFNDGSIQKCEPFLQVPPGYDPVAGVYSKDVIISSEPSISARIFMPRLPDRNARVPLLVYFHGGGFSLQSPFSPRYHSYMTSVVAEAKVIAVSVDYRKAPENPIPACYDDAWEALQWVARHGGRNGSGQWLNCNADPDRVFLAGDSAGANIIYNTMLRAGPNGFPGIKVRGLALFHPYFSRAELFGDNMWMFLCPGNDGVDDRRIRPTAEDLDRIPCERIMICVGEKDPYRDAGVGFYQELKKSGWRGKAELVESKGVGHVFHLLRPGCEQADELMKKLASFINQEEPIEIGAKLMCKL